ncbi:hypothetical protein KY305_19640 [Bacillus sp. YC2]|uniref:hypothetical protein n=1 Tax=Bacillus sp. YC2 TaxID=2861287 RepID=UPI001CA65D7E|nr:hypothetical protein [Bacillus sp. YC2]MBY8914931.1 hypothetical protein [Bacillus sp. YC2]
MNLLGSKGFLCFLSFLFTLMITFIPSIGLREEGSDRFYGYPAQWLDIRVNGNISFELWGLLFNFLLFFLIFWGLKRILLFLLKNKK